MSKNKKQKEEKKPDYTMEEYLAAQQELEELRAANGIEKKEGPISRVISAIFEAKDNRQLHRVKKKTYIILALLLGWIGGHRFYEKRWILGIIYFIFGVIKFPVLTGFPVAMTIIDILIAIPIQKDEEGYILI